MNYYNLNSAEKLGLWDMRHILSLRSWWLR